jgi:hypothetical protein
MSSEPNAFLDWYIAWLLGRADGIDTMWHVWIVGLPPAPAVWDDAALPLLCSVLQYAFEKHEEHNAKKS